MTIGRQCTGSQPKVYRVQGASLKYTRYWQSALSIQGTGSQPKVYKVQAVSLKYTGYREPA